VTDLAVLGVDIATPRVWNGIPHISFSLSPCTCQNKFHPLH